MYRVSNTIFGNVENAIVEGSISPKRKNLVKLLLLDPLLDWIITELRPTSQSFWVSHRIHPAQCFVVFGRWNWHSTFGPSEQQIHSRDRGKRSCCFAKEMACFAKGMPSQRYSCADCQLRFHLHFHLDDHGRAAPRLMGGHNR